MVDSITLATVTSAVVVLATECAKGVSSASKDLWGKVKSLFGWHSEPKPTDLAQAVASKLEKDDALVVQILDLLKSDSASGTPAGTLVGNIDATKVVVATRIDVAGDFKM